MLNVCERRETKPHRKSNYTHGLLRTVLLLETFLGKFCAHHLLHGCVPSGGRSSCGEETPGETGSVPILSNRNTRTRAKHAWQSKILLDTGHATVLLHGAKRTKPNQTQLTRLVSLPTTGFQTDCRSCNWADIGKVLYRAHLSPSPSAPKSNSRCLQRISVSGSANKCSLTAGQSGWCTQNKKIDYIVTDSTQRRCYIVLEVCHEQLVWTSRIWLLLYHTICSTESRAVASRWCHSGFIICFVWPALTNWQELPHIYIYFVSTDISFRLSHVSMKSIQVHDRHKFCIISTSIMYPCTIPVCWRHDKARIVRVSSLIHAKCLVGS